MQVQSATLSYVSVATRSQPWIEFWCVLCHTFSRSRCSKLSREGPEGHSCSWACGLASQLIYLHPPALAADRDATTSCCSQAHHTPSVSRHHQWIHDSGYDLFPVSKALLCIALFRRIHQRHDGPKLFLDWWHTTLAMLYFFTTLLFQFMNRLRWCVWYSEHQCRTCIIEKCYVYHNLMIHSLSKDKAPVDLLLVLFGTWVHASCLLNFLL